MAERIDVPPTLQGDEKAQLQQLWSYLYQMSDAINNNLQGIGGNELTDSERKTMQMILSAGEKAPELSEMETLKSLIIKTADYVQTSLQEYRMKLLGESVDSGKFGRYVRSTGLDVAVTPEGIMQNYSFQEIIQGLKTYEINAKNYIKTGLLRTVSSIPVYGVAIGKDVVTFSEDGTETYNDGNKVAELTADELSFWQNGVKVAGYTGNRISFYYNESEVFYIQNGKLYAVGDIEITNGKKMILASGAGLEVKSGGNLKVSSGGNIDIRGTGNLLLTGSQVSISSGSTFSVDSTNLNIDSINGRLTILNGGLKVNKLFGVGQGINYEFFIGEPFGNWSPNNAIRGSLTPANLVYSEKNIYLLDLNIEDELTEPGTKISLFTYFGYNRITHHSTYPGFPETATEYAPSIYMMANKYNKSTGVSTTMKTVLLFTEAVFNVADISTIYSFDVISTFIHGGEIYYDHIYQNSSRDIKHNILPLPSVGEKIDRLEPVTFTYDRDENEETRMGLIYEDTMEVMPEICTRDESNKAINYIELVPALLKEIQDLRKRVAELERRMNDVQGA